MGSTSIIGAVEHLLDETHQRNGWKGCFVFAYISNHIFDIRCLKFEPYKIVPYYGRVPLANFGVRQGANEKSAMTPRIWRIRTNRRRIRTNRQFAAKNLAPFFRSFCQLSVRNLRTMLCELVRPCTMTYDDCLRQQFSRGQIFNMLKNSLQACE